MTHVHVIPDTNVLLDSEMPDAMSWKQVTDGEGFSIVLVITVIDELDHLKNDVRRPERQAKARDLLTKLGTLLAKVNADSQVILPSGVALQLGVVSLRHDWVALGLDPTQMDDRILADAIALASRADAATRVIVLTNDVGLALRCRARQIEVMAPPDAIRSALAETEQARLQRELNRLKNRQPRLILGVGTGPSVLSRDDDAKAYWTDIDADTQRLLQEERQRVEACLRERTGGDRAIIMHDNLVLAARYHMEDFSDAVYFQALRQRGVVIQLDLLLRNPGSMPATNVELYLNFPEHSLVIGEDDIEKYYAFPKTDGVPWAQVERPRSSSPFDRLGSMAALTVMPSRDSWALADIRREIQLLRQEPPQGPFYDETYRETMPDFPIGGLRYSRRENPTRVSFEARRLSHHKPWQLPRLLVLLPPERRSGFEIAYSMYCDELLEPTEGKLGVPLLSGEAIEGADESN